MTGSLRQHRSHRIARSCAAAALLALTFAIPPAHAQQPLQRIDPPQTDPSVETVQGPHIALYDPQVPSNHRLFVFFAGTRARPEGSLPLDRAFAALGYHVVALDYENGVLAASCGPSSNPACFDTYRDAIVTGAPGSDKITVTPANAILNRLQKLLVYLATHDPNGGWNEFVTGNEPAWNRIVLAGHSQGAGHAAFLAKLHAVDKVLMFSGPQDYLSTFDKPASWQSRPSATPPSRFFAFLSLHDPFNVHHQIANCAALMQLPQPETAHVEPGQPIAGAPRILINDTPAPQAHGSTISPAYQTAWDYLGQAREPAAAPRPHP